MIRSLHRRYLDILASVYIYNEHRGYTSIDRVLEAVRACCPDDHRFIAEVEKHRTDERKHYVMFKRWFEINGRRPFRVDRTCGHIDRFVEIMFGRGIDALDTQAIIADKDQFERLCRVIMLTEQRGMRQVEVLLKSPLVRADPVMMKIFRIIERDEPSHWQPYQAWLDRTGRKQASWLERAVDFWIHRELLLFKIPALYLNPWLARQDAWADAAEAPPKAALAV
ncbi:MAG: hypothetical protein C0476_08380 [Sphingomonas sp.]|nr:hypothetical protein [Sphingomonas sp.]